jgi:molecular chaperone GrpE
MMDNSKIEAGNAPDATAEMNSAAQDTGAAEAAAAQETATAAADATATEQAPASEGEAAVDFPALIAQLEAGLAEERTRAEKLLDQTQRMAAEFQNSRKRQENQLHEEIERASAHLIKRLLPVIDDLDLAFAHVPPDLEEGAAWIEGFRQIQKKLHSLLAEEGVTTIPEGEFDPTLHEAVSGEPSDSVPTGHVIATLRAGYTYKGKVLRPALVRVAM